MVGSKVNNWKVHLNLFDDAHTADDVSKYDVFVVQPVKRLPILDVKVLIND